MFKLCDILQRSAAASRIALTTCDLQKQRQRATCSMWRLLEHVHQHTACHGRPPAAGAPAKKLPWWEDPAKQGTIAAVAADHGQTRRADNTIEVPQEENMFPGLEPTKPQGELLLTVCAPTWS